MQKLLYYAPRVLTVLFTIFIGFFAIDVFTDTIETQNLLLNFLIHLIPNFVFFVALIFAWRHERFGGLLFLALFIAALLLFKNPYPTNVILFAPLILVSFLFEYHYAITHKRRVRKMVNKIYQ